MLINFTLRILKTTLFIGEFQLIDYGCTLEYQPG